MDTRTTRRGIPTAVIWGGFGALAWAALTVLTGGSAAQADEQGGGPLDGLTSVVSETVSSVTAPVAPVVTQVVAPVVTAVVAPVQQAAPAVVQTVTETVAQTPVVGSVAAPVVQTVTETVQTVVTPVTEVLTDAPVSQITDPILDAVTGLPIVGDVVTDLGVIDLVDDVVGIADDTTDLIGGVVDKTLPPVVGALDPSGPGGGETPGEPGSPVVVATASPYSAASSSSAPGTAPALVTVRPVAPATLPTAAVDDRGAPGGGTKAPSGTPPGSPVAPTSFAGPGGGYASAHARPSDVGAPSLHAWERASGASDDALPASPVAGTDVSPD